MKGAALFEEALTRPEESAPPAEEPLADRLRNCSRLLALAGDEVEALRRGDAVRCRELAEAREELVEEMFPAAGGSEEEEDGVPPTLAERIADLLIEALESLELREEEERRMQDRWSSLEEDALRAMHVGGRIRPPRAGRYENHLLQDTHLDLRF